VDVCASAVRSEGTPRARLVSATVKMFLGQSPDREATGEDVYGTYKHRKRVRDQRWCAGGAHTKRRRGLGLGTNVCMMAGKLAYWPQNSEGVCVERVRPARGNIVKRKA